MACIFISIGNYIFAMEDSGKNFRKKLLKQHKYAQIIKDPAQRALYIASAKKELKERAKRLERQKNSYFSRAGHFVYKGIWKLACAGLLMQGTNYFLKESTRSSSLLDQALTGVSAIGLGYLGVWCGLDGIKSMYNNLLYWQTRKDNKIKINNAALASLNEKDSEI